MNLLRSIIAPAVCVAFLSITSCTKAIISEAPQTTVNTGDTITYQSHIQAIISANCLGCHSGSNPQGNLLLESYTQVRNATENGTLITRINDQGSPMPTSGLMPVSTRSLFTSWVTAGYLEN